MIKPTVKMVASLFEALIIQPHEPPPLHCRILQTYLPPSLLPSSCVKYFQEGDDLYYYPQWAWSLINTAFVSTITMINSAMFMMGVFLWMANRQFHFSRKKHSYDKEPLMPLKPLKRARKRGSNVLKKAKRNIINKVRKGRGVITVEDADENEEKVNFDGTQEKEILRNNNFSSFLEDVEEDIHTTASVVDQPRKRIKSNSEQNSAKDLLQLVSKIEVFSYLSPRAAKEILNYIEYVDLSSDPIGKVIFDNTILDGSLYAVVSGQVTMRLSVQKHHNNDASEDEHSFEFVAGPGEVMTSLLTLISSLVQEYQVQEAFTSSPIHGPTKRDLIGVDINDKPLFSEEKHSLIPDGIIVRAVISASNTVLMRIPSKCFVNILDRFPQDVHQVCQTIVARLQRVTIQSLVRFLGLEDEVLGSRINGPERKPRKTAEWKLFEESLDVPSLNASLLDQSIKAAASLLGLPPDKSNLLKDGSSITSFSPGSTICQSGETPGFVYLVIKGSLEISYKKNEKEDHTMKIPKESTINDHYQGVKNRNRKPLFSAGSGSFIGLFSSFTGDASFINAVNPASEGNALLLKIPSRVFEGIVSAYPKALIHCLIDILDTIGSSPSVYLLDWMLDWQHLDAGQYVAIEGQRCNSMFVVLNGRLRAESSSPASTSSSGPASTFKCIEFGRGDTIGSLEALAEERWSYNVLASRHCEVARVPMSLLSILMSLYPAASIHFTKVVAKMQSRKGRNLNKFINATESLLPSYGLSLATIAVVPLSPEIDTSEFCRSLTASLCSIAPTKLLTKDETVQRIGKNLLTHPSALLKMKMTRFLGDIEENNRLVLYQSDLKFTWWTKLAIQQADCVIVVVDSNKAPNLSQIEDCLSWAHNVKNVRIELAVVQYHLASNPGEHASDEVNDWNEDRPWISKQHLLRAPFKEHVEDFSRMCRRVTGQSIGLVLGGGGARGLAHLGVIKALTEVGVNVDLVGGTSQGAFIGALYARNPDNLKQLEDTARAMAESMSSMKEKLLDLTFPITSFFNGSRFNHGIHKFLGETRIQDLVLNFYCVSVDIRNSCQVVHRKGIAWKAIRASMSLAGYLPPLSEGTALLVDGGYMNIVPADIMAESAKKVIAVDVSYEKVHDFYEYGAELSGFWLIWNSWNPFVKTVRVPSMGDINERLSWISAERFKKHVVENKVDLFLRPPVDDYGTLEFNKYDEIVQIGYEYAKPLVEQWAKENGYLYKRD